jgi:hypothetical protein
MAATYMTDITDFLDEYGDIAVESGPDLRFAEYLTSIICQRFRENVVNAAL